MTKQAPQQTTHIRVPESHIWIGGGVNYPDGFADGVDIRAKTRVADLSPKQAATLEDLKGPTWEVPDFVKVWGFDDK